MNSMLLLPPQVISHNILSFLEAKDLQQLDNAVVNANASFKLQFHQLWKMFQYNNLQASISLDDLLWMLHKGIQVVGVAINFRKLNRSKLLYLPDINASTLKELLVLTCNSQRTANSLLSKIARGSPLLSVVRIFDCPITDEGIRVLTSHCKQLTTIHLRRTCITDTAIHCICENCPLLRTIELINNHGLTNQSLYAIAQTYPNLESITADEHSFDRQGYEALAHSCHNLISAELADDVGEHVSGIWLNNHKLTSVSLTMRHMNESSIIQLAERCPNLQFLRISTYSDVITDAAIFAIARNCPHLRSLYLHTCISDDEQEERCHHFARWHTTVMGSYFCFYGLRKLSATAYIALVNAYAHMQTLHVHCCNIDDEAIHALSSRCHELRQVVIGDCNITPNALLSLFAANPNIRALEIGRSVDISDAEVDLLIQRCPKLNEVIIHASGKMTGTSITSFVERCDYMEMLDVITSCDSNASVHTSLIDHSDIYDYDIKSEVILMLGVIVARKGCELHWRFRRICEHPHYETDESESEA